MNCWELTGLSTRGESGKEGIGRLCCVNVKVKKRDFIREHIQSSVCVGAGAHLSRVSAVHSSPDMQFLEVFSRIRDTTLMNSLQ